MIAIGQEKWTEIYDDGSAATSDLASSPTNRVSSPSPPSYPTLLSRHHNLVAFSG